MKPAHRFVLALVLVCFWFSGMAGLVYQIVWARYLALFLGHTSYAVVAVLVAFMGGLALGNAWLGGRADRSPRPLRLYAWLEIGIGLYALAFPAYYALCHAMFVGLARHLGAGRSCRAGAQVCFQFAHHPPAHGVDGRDVSGVDAVRNPVARGTATPRGGALRHQQRRGPLPVASSRISGGSRHSDCKLPSSPARR